MNRNLVLVGICLLLVFSSCHRSCELEPQINYAVQDRYLKSLPSPFAPLNSEESAQDWGREYRVGLGFAKQLDLYQAMTSFRRADILMPDDLEARKTQVEYDTLLAYYLGKKYSDVTYTYENSHLNRVGKEFTPLHDLLVILYDSYIQVGEVGKAELILNLIKELFSSTEKKLVISTALKNADMGTLYELSDKDPNDTSLSHLLASYEASQKSATTAQALNAFLPGAGYFYLGQRQSAVTAFLLNGLFIAAAYTFFHRGHTAAGIITTGFEAGWYFGGIYGAKEETKFYNERIYENLASPMMNQKGLFPVLMLKYGF